MNAEDLLRLEWVADPRISPDGSRIAFTRVAIDAEADAYVTSIWIVDADGAGPPRPLTTGRNDAQPRWSPDGTRLAFVRRPEAEGDEKPAAQLHVLRMDGGEPQRLTELKKGASSPAWSPDGARLAFLSGTNPAIDDDPERKEPKNPPGRVVTKPVFRWNDEGFVDEEHPVHVWVVPADGSAPPRQLTAGPLKDDAPAWSRDGTRVLFLSDRRPEPWFEHEEQRLYAVPADAAAPLGEDGFETVIWIRGPLVRFAETAQGGFVAVGGVRPERFNSYDANELLAFEGAWPHRTPRRVAPALDADIAADEIAGDAHPPRGGGQKPLALSGDGAHVYTAAGLHGASVLVRVSLADGTVEELTGRDREVVHASATPDAGRIALTLGHVGSPGDLFVYETAKRTLRRVWGPNDALLAETSLGEVEEVWYESFDGQRIQGWIVKPPGFDPARTYPLVLQIHGGPHVAYGIAFVHEFRMLAAAGYVVLYVNPRGSTTYGHAFANVIQYRYPGDDYKDLMAGVDLLLERGYVDAKRLGVTGGSGGGLLTNWVVTHTDRFAAAVTQRCVSDWAGMYYSCDFAMFTPWWFRKPPFEDFAEYAERSPVHLASRVTTPLMVVHSEEDWRTPIAQGEAMFRALKQQKKPTVMVRFPGENHELSRSGTPSRRVQRLRHIQRWFDRWLCGVETPEYGV